MAILGISLLLLFALITWRGNLPAGHPAIRYFGDLHRGFIAALKLLVASFAIALCCSWLLITAFLRPCLPDWVMLRLQRRDKADLSGVTTRCPPALKARSQLTEQPSDGTSESRALLCPVEAHHDDEDPADSTALLQAVHQTHPKAAGTQAEFRQ